MAKIEMYYSEWCGFCHRARRLLEIKNVEWSGHDVDMDAGKRQEMMDRGSGYTVPQLFVDDVPIGGCAELFALEAEGRLDAVLGLESVDADVSGSGSDGGSGE